MKKLFILFVLLVFSISVMGQRTASLLPNETYKVLTMTGADTVGYATTVYFTFALNKPKTQYWAVAAKMDPTGVGTPHVWVTVWGSIDGTNFVNTGATTVKYGGGADSLFQIVDVSTGILWKYLKVQFAGVAGTANKGELIKALAIKVGDK